MSYDDDAINDEDREYIKTFSTWLQEIIANLEKPKTSCKYKIFAIRNIIRLHSKNDDYKYFNHELKKLLTNERHKNSELLKLRDALTKRIWDCEYEIQQLKESKGV